MTHGFRREGKTAAKDAKVIAETARLRNDLSNAELTDELVVELTRLTDYPADLMADSCAAACPSRRGRNRRPCSARDRAEEGLAARSAAALNEAR